MSVSDSLFARALQLMPGGVNSPVRAFRSVGGAPFFVKRAEGAHLITADDRTLTVRNLDAWYPAFGVKEGQALYLAPDKRVKVW